jgi:20S proteasome alpha/beta subunit
VSHAGVRPFGVSFLIAGIDADGPHLYLTDPSGAFWNYFAFAIGASATEARAYLESELMGDNLNKNTCDIAFILKEDKTFKLLSLDEKEELLNKISTPEN